MESFIDCPFQGVISSIEKEGKIIHLSLEVISKPYMNSLVVVNEVTFEDKLQNVYSYNVNGGVKKIEQETEQIDVDFELYNRGMFLMRDAVIKCSFLTNDRITYIAEYQVMADNSVHLNSVDSKIMDKEELAVLRKYLAESHEEYDDQAADEDVDDYGDGVEEFPSQLISGNVVINKYKKAILREKYYLKEEGGREYTVTNGKIISRYRGLCTYTFEMETELFLSDDAPVTVIAGGKEANGSVVSCEDFQILITVDRDLGLSVNKASIRVEPWKLLDAIANNLERISRSTSLAWKLINEGPAISTSNPIGRIPKGQEAAIEKAANEDITVIWGPPGTGKTYTMSKIALNAIQNNNSVLVVSHSNVSVDGVVKAVAAQAREAGLDDLMQKGKILRFGYVRDEELKEDKTAVAYNYVLEKNPEIKKSLNELLEKKDKLKRSGNYNTSKGLEVEQKLKDIRSNIKELEKHYVQEAKFVATTISKVTVEKMFANAKYDVVMFDEVSMAYIPQILCAAMRAKKKLVLVGDFKQLPPIAQSEVKDTLEEDIFNFLKISIDGQMYAHPWLVMLNEQRRMYPTISAFANKYVYNDLLLDHPSVIENRKDTINREPFHSCSINLLDLVGTYCAASKNKDNSRFNILSAILSFLTALYGEHDGQKSIGIITPYAAQTRLIRAMIQDHREREETDVECATVHQFQGSERDTIIFDAVESYPSTRAGVLLGRKLEAVTRLINVAVTRAKGKIVVVTNSKFWELNYKDKNHVVYNLVQYLKLEGNHVSTREDRLQKYLLQLPNTKNIKNYQDNAAMLEAFAADVAKAQERLIISIPDGGLDIETEAILFKIISDAKERGITILCKTKDYEELPANWKSIALASDNADFPILMIDDKVMWYGIPRSIGRFKNGKTTFTTVCPTVYRIQGTHTLEYIKSVAALETRELDGKYTALQPKEKLSKSVFGLNKSGDENANGYLEVGLAQYVSEVCRCPICRQPMALTRSAKGKDYLKCSSKTCTKIEYLSKDVTNSYIEQRRVKCPTHHCGLHAGVNKLGIYVRCEMGHYLKPDEI